MNIEDLEAEKFYEAIRQGVHDAMWKMITNATSMPCLDFYDTIGKAAQEAFTKAADRRGDQQSGLCEHGNGPMCSECRALQEGVVRG